MIITQFDESYLAWAEILVASIALYAPNEKVFIEAVNISREKVMKLRGLHKAVKIKHVDVEHPVDSTIPWREIMIRRCWPTLRDTMNVYKSNMYIMLDADLMLRPDFKDIYELMEDHAIGGVMPNDNKFCAGILAVNAKVLGPKGERFIDDLANAMLINTDRKNLDQAISSEMWVQHRHEIKFRNLGRRFLDPDMSDGGAIWTPHKIHLYGDKKRQLARYWARLENERDHHLG